MDNDSFMALIAELDNHPVCLAREWIRTECQRLAARLVLSGPLVRVEVVHWSILFHGVT